MPRFQRKQMYPLYIIKLFLHDKLNCILLQKVLNIFNSFFYIFYTQQLQFKRMFAYDIQQLQFTTMFSDDTQQ